MALRYSTEIHAVRLRKMFDGEQFEGCPAAAFFNSGRSCKSMWSEGSRPCYICTGFVDLESERLERNFGWAKCPCFQLGNFEAQRITRVKLEEYFNQ